MTCKVLGKANVFVRIFIEQALVTVFKRAVKNGYQDRREFA
jgi:hypothetical protein